MSDAPGSQDEAAAEPSADVDAASAEASEASSYGASNLLADARKANRAATIRGVLIVLLLIALSLSWRARSADAGAREAAEMATAAQRAGEEFSAHLRECEERRDVCLGTLNGLGRPLAWIGHECTERCVLPGTAPATATEPSAD